MKYLLFLLFIISIPGCFGEDVNSRNTSREVNYKKITIREIDSLSAHENYKISIQNNSENQIIDDEIK
jgi:hypothetical protein